MSSGERRYEVIHLSDLEMDGKSNEVFRGRSRILDSLNGDDVFAVDEVLEDEVSEQEMESMSPFGKTSSGIRHSMEVTNSYARENAQRLLDKGEGQDLEFDPEGEIYNVKLNEFFEDSTLRPDSNSDKITHNVLESANTDVDLLNIHMVCYEDPQGGNHLVHWDPGAFESENGEKEKYLSQGEDLSTEKRMKKEDQSFYIDDSNYSLAKGLDVVTEQLNGLANKYISAAKDVGGSKSCKMAWMGYRWDAMADAISDFSKLQEGKSSQVSFSNQNNEWYQ